MPSKNPPPKTVRPVKTSGNTTGKSGSRRPSEKPSRIISKSRKHSHAHHSRKTSSKWHSDKSRTKHASKKASTRKRGAKTERHPSSSLGRGAGDPITITMLVLLGISAVVFFVIGVWLLATQDGWPVGLNNTGNRTWTRFISYGTACVVLSLLLIPILIFIILDAAATRGSQARITRLVVVFISSFLVLVLLLMSVTGIMFAANRPGFIANIIEDAWTKTVLKPDSVATACEVERDFSCRGWRTNSCLNCNPTVNGVYQNCLPQQQLVCPRCFPAAPVQVDSSGQTGTTTVQGGVPQGSQGTTTTTTQDGATPVAVGDTGTDQLVQRDIKRERNGFEWTERQETQVSIRGCRNPVLRRYRSFFIPMTVYTLFLLLLLIVLSYKTCVDSSRR